MGEGRSGSDGGTVGNGFAADGFLGDGKAPMGAEVVKLITLLKRRPGMTMEAFMHRYEQVHARLGERVLAGHVIHYVRRYLLPLTGAEAPDDRPHDVVMEIWFENEAAFARAMAALTEPALAAEIAADEDETFDRTRTVTSRIVEHVSVLPPALPV